MTCQRGTTNGNARGSSEDRRRRREWLVRTYRADRDLLQLEAWQFTPTGMEPRYIEVPKDAGGVMACRCYRCGYLLTEDTVTIDRIIPGCQGGTYRRTNIRPACGPCNSETGGATRRLAA